MSQDPNNTLLTILVLQGQKGQPTDLTPSGKVILVLLLILTPVFIYWQGTMCGVF